MKTNRLFSLLFRLLAFVSVMFTFGGCSTAPSVKKMDSVTPALSKIPLRSAAGTNIVPTSRYTVIDGVRFNHVYTDMSKEAFIAAISNRGVPYRIATDEEMEKFIAEVGELPKFSNVTSYVTTPVNKTTSASALIPKTVTERLVRISDKYLDLDNARYYLLYSTVPPEKLPEKLKAFMGTGYKIASDYYRQKFFETFGEQRSYPGYQQYVIRSLDTRHVGFIPSSPGVSMHDANFMYGYFGIEKDAVLRALEDGQKLMPGWRLATDDEIAEFQVKVDGKTPYLEAHDPKMASKLVRLVVARLPMTPIKQGQTVAVANHE